MINDSSKTEDELIISLITNTKRSIKGRNKSIVEIANDIQALKNKKGNLSDVAKIAKVSSNMLQKFLAVNKLNKKVFNLVKNRTIDSIETVHSLTKFPSEMQDIIAEHVLNGKLSSQDVRALSPYFRQNPREDINMLIERLLKSKNIKVSVINFPFEPGFNLKTLEHTFIEIVKTENFISITENEGIGSLRINKEGEKKLRSKAKSENYNLSELVSKLIKDSI